jgi:thioredoxin-dependent peroxiredoxin
MTTPEPAIREQPLSVGETAPDFTLPAVLDGGEQVEVHLAELTGKGPLMLIFYQDDGMPICTRELQAFAQEHELLAEAGIQVFGINTNGLGSHAKFHERDHYPFPLISDFHAEVVKGYGMWDGDERKSKRGVVVIGRDGRVQYVLPHFNPGSVAAFEQVFRALGLV